ncbi:MAG: hypothetical protein E6Q97_16700 [Desulfurellales bacterium]|nr:MAG: hypothetical protein E6Q97_16700 [Desulfurellales bacterium]
MTDEQKQTVAGIKRRNEERGEWMGGSDLSQASAEQAVYDCADLLSIIDDLQKEVEQLTKERDDARADANYMKVVAGVK